MDSLAVALTRALVAEDARWIADVMLSARTQSNVRGIVPMCMLGHSARICFEGSRALRSKEAGVAELAELLPRAAPAIERARHASKFLDDTAYSFEDFLIGLEEFRAASRARFFGNAVRGARWLESDLGLYFARGQLIGGTIPIQFRSGLPAEVPFDDLGPLLFELAQEQGGILVALSAASGQVPTLEASIEFQALEPIRSRDRRSSRYLRRRYEPSYPDTVKLALLVLEVELGSAMQIVSATRASHTNAALRANLISLFHIISSLQKILEKFPTDSRSSRALAAITTSGVGARLVGPDFRALRNLFMHYVPRGTALKLSRDLPMFGITDALCGTSSEELGRDLHAVASELAEVFTHW